MEELAAVVQVPVYDSVVTDASLNAKADELEDPAPVPF